MSMYINLCVRCFPIRKNILLVFTTDKLFPMDYKVVSAFLESVSVKWQEIGRELGLSEQTCYRIREANGGNPEACCSQMIEEYLIEKEVNFNWFSLTEALRNLNMEHLADTILLEWGVCNIWNGYNIILYGMKYWRRI